MTPPVKPAPAPDPPSPSKVSKSSPPRGGSIDSVLLALMGKAPPPLEMVSSQSEAFLPPIEVPPVSTDPSHPILAKNSVTSDASRSSQGTLPVPAACVPTDKGKGILRGDSTKAGPSRLPPASRRHGVLPPMKLQVRGMPVADLPFSSDIVFWTAYT
ncbi:hypothetical protein QJS10_CPB11g00378 [Acorus calamus]|uniref:Uncharacterized protein n=1 Tax=Acorus calamus TaxID=4465 RepID=A0AAV9DU07_ACOCL|nr:hypothetical protein QJS10_CPB11g00378 [Acorus calamus]